MSRRGPVRAVTFDYWNTLVVSDAPGLQALRVRRWVALLNGARVRCSVDRIEDAFATVWAEHQAAHDRNEQYDAERAARRSIELLGLDVPADLADALVEAFGSAGASLDLRPAPGALDAVRRLQAAGIRLGIVCDVGFTPSPVLRTLLDRWGVLGCFSSWAFSDEVGAYKPAAAIFDHALAGLGVEPHRAAHVGDLRATDVAGARAMGMLSIRYAGVHDDPPADGRPEAHHVIVHHDELDGVLDA